MLLAREQAAPVHPGPRLVETVTSGEVVTMRFGEAASSPAGELVEQRAEARTASTSPAGS
jgi:hypothetical protein